MNERPEPATTAPARRRRWPRVLVGLLLACALGAAAGVAWLASESALRHALARAVAASQGRLTIEGAQGSLLTQVRVARLAWQGEAVDVEVREAALSWNLWDLISRRFTVTHLSAGTLSVKLHKATGSRNGLPASLALPLEVEVRQVRVRNLEWATPQGQGAVNNIAFSYAGGAASHRLADLHVTLPEGTLTGAVEIGALAPFAVRGDLAFAGAGTWQAARVAVKVAGSLERFDVVADGNLRDATLAARIVATPFAELPLVSAALDAHGVNAAQWDPNWPVTDLTLMLVARPEGDRFVGTIDARNARPGPVDAARIPAESLTARFAWQDGTLALEDAAIRVAGGGTASGRITMPTRGGASDGALQLRQFDLARIQSTLPTTRLSGPLAAQVTGTRQNVRGNLRDDTPGAARAGARSVDFAAVVEGRRVRVDSFRAQAGGGTLAGRGNLALDGGRAFSVSARATNFDPSRFADVPPGLLKGTIDASGTLAPVWDVSAAATLEVGSKFAGTAVSGRARALATPGRVTALDLKLRAASATLALEGAWGGAADRLQFALDAPRLAELRPLLQPLTVPWTDALDGVVRLKGTLSGAARNPGLELDAHAKALQWGETLRAATIDVAASVAPGTDTSLAFDQRALQITVLGTGLAAPPGELKTAKVEVKGSLARHQGAASAAGAGFAVDAAFSGGLEERKGGDGKVDLTWSGSLARLTHAGRVALALEAPATLVVSRSRVALGGARIAIAEGHADLERLTVDAGRIDTRGSFTGIPADAVARLAGATLPITSTLVLGGDWNLLAAPKLNGEFNVRRERGDVYAAEEGGLGDAERAFGLTALGLSGRFVDGALDASALLRTSRGGTADATFGMAAPAAPGSPATEAALHGTLRADMTTLRPFQPWLGTAAAIDGRARLDAQVAGTLARPTYSGGLAGDALRLAFPQHGVLLQDGRLRARLVDRTIVLDELSMAGGAGRFVAEGILAQARADDSEPAAGGARVDLRWHADQLTLVNQPELQIVAGGNGRVTLTDRRLLLNGTVDVVRGNVILAPVVAGRLSNDVVIVGRPRAPAGTGGTGAVPLSLDVDLGLGSNFRFSGGGLESRLEGRVRFTSDAAGALFAKGTIRTAEGTYSAFGQRLAIDRGNLIFDGRADNPGLDVLALRRNLAVEAGVEVQGTVRAPIVRLVSNPPVPEGEQLAWLITGQGLDRASSADLLALSAASASLLSGRQRPLASLLQSRLGVDDVSVRDAGSAAGGSPSGQVIALSRRISDRLSVVYEHGLTAANNALRMEYALSQTLTLRVDAGTVGSFGLYFWRAFN